MPCLFAMIAGIFPRLGTIIIWIARPALFNAAFNTWIWPVLGIIFLPFTTLMYVILWSPGIGLSGWDWFWLIMAVVIDLMHWSSTAYQNRNSIPGYAGS
jgi:hypothetical protein